MSRTHGFMERCLVACLGYLCSDGPLGLGQSSGWGAGEMLQALGLGCRAAEPWVSSAAGPLGDMQG